MRLAALKAAACAAAFLVGIPAAHAIDSKGSFVVKGEGTSSCQRYIDAVDKKEAQQVLAFRAWVNGFLSAFNTYVKDTHDIAPVHSIDALSVSLYGTCKHKPESKFSDAVLAVIQLLGPSRLPSQSPIINAKAGNNAVRVPQSVLARAQVKLIDLGLYKAQPDGTYNAATRAALKAYQEREKLAVTELPDERTLIKLLF